MIARALAVAILVAVPCMAAAPDIPWDVDTSDVVPAPKPLVLRRGETVTLTPRYMSHNRVFPLTNGESCVLQYRSFDMAAGTYYALTGAVHNATNGQTRVTWTADACAQATNYQADFVVTSSGVTNLRAFATITLVGSVFNSSTTATNPPIHLGYVISTNLNASHLVAGTVPLSRLSGLTSNQIDATTDAAYRSGGGGGGINGETATNIATAVTAGIIATGNCFTADSAVFATTANNSASADSAKALQNGATGDDLTLTTTLTVHGGGNVVTNGGIIINGSALGNGTNITISGPRPDATGTSDVYAIVGEVLATGNCASATSAGDASTLEGLGKLDYLNLDQAFGADPPYPDFSQHIVASRPVADVGIGVGTFFGGVWDTNGFCLGYQMTHSNPAMRKPWLTIDPRTSNVAGRVNFTNEIYALGGGNVVTNGQIIGAATNADYATSAGVATGLVYGATKAMLTADDDLNIYDLTISDSTGTSGGWHVGVASLFPVIGFDYPLGTRRWTMTGNATAFALTNSAYAYAFGAGGNVITNNATGVNLSGTLTPTNSLTVTNSLQLGGIAAASYVTNNRTSVSFGTVAVTGSVSATSLLTDADTGWVQAWDNAFYLRVGGTDKFICDANGVRPDQDKGFDCGGTSKRWKSFASAKLTDSGTQVGVATISPTAGYDLDVNGSALIRTNLTVQGVCTSDVFGCRAFNIAGTNAVRAAQSESTPAAQAPFTNVVTVSFANVATNYFTNSLPQKGVSISSTRISLATTNNLPFSASAVRYAAFSCPDALGGCSVMICTNLTVSGVWLTNDVTTIGTNQVLVSDASPFAVDDLIYLTPSPVATGTGEYTRVQSISGTTITTWTPLIATHAATGANTGGVCRVIELPSWNWLSTATDHVARVVFTNSVTATIRVQTEGW